MTKKTVSIVIPAFNRTRLVAKAVACAFAQAHPCKIIVCNHGSKDDTPRVLQKYGAAVYPGVDIVHDYGLYRPSHASPYE
jgi:glycosyltransferase involved in cell wall biosynthesis